MRQAPPPAGHRFAGRRTSGRAQQDHLLDPYQKQAKLTDGAVCIRCGAVYHEGRWTWSPRPQPSHETECPACRRIADEAPAGSVLLQGAFAREHKDEIIGLARHQEEAEKQEHPLNRIIAISDEAEGIVVTTTDIHLPRRIGEAVKRAFHGDLDMHFDDNAFFARVVWSGPA